MIKKSIFLRKYVILFRYKTCDVHVPVGRKQWIGVQRSKHVSKTFVRNPHVFYRVTIYLVPNWRTSLINSIAHTKWHIIQRVTLWTETLSAGHKRNWIDSTDYVFLKNQQSWRVSNHRASQPTAHNRRAFIDVENQIDLVNKLITNLRITELRSSAGQQRIL